MPSRVWRPAPTRTGPGRGLELVRAGEFRREAAYLTLEQALGGDAAATIFFLAPLDAILAAWRRARYRARESGSRHRRRPRLPGGVRRPRFGASGLTFYDADVVRFFSPHAEGGDAIFVTALGHAEFDAERRATIEHDPTAAEEVVSR